MSIRTITILTLITLFGSLLAGCAPASASVDSQETQTALVTNQVEIENRVSPDSTLYNSPSTPIITEPAFTPTLPSSLLPTEEIQASPTPSQSPATPTATPCPPNMCSYSFPYFLERPIALPGNDIVDATYRFGTTQGGKRDPHHGVEFLNAFGTPVQAAAAGTVVFAGEDREAISEPGIWPPIYFGPFPYFYGNVVIIQHQLPEAARLFFPDIPSQLFTVYAHLSEISVENGQLVEVGQEIGKVGMTGIAEGSHLHFEVRLGENRYENVRNPELWLVPHQDRNGQMNGGLAGSIVDSQGNQILLEGSLVLEHLPLGPDQPNDLEVYLQDYEERALIGQPPFSDSFATGDLPAGLYRLSFPHNGLQQVLLEVFPGQLTWFRILVD